MKYDKVPWGRIVVHLGLVGLFRRLCERITLIGVAGQLWLMPLCFERLTNQCRDLGG